MLEYNNMAIHAKRSSIRITNIYCITYSSLAFYPLQGSFLSLPNSISASTYPPISGFVILRHRKGWKLPSYLRPILSALGFYLHEGFLPLQVTDPGNNHRLHGGWKDIYNGIAKAHKSYPE